MIKVHRFGKYQDITIVSTEKDWGEVTGDKSPLRVSLDKDGFTLDWSTE